MQEYPTLYHKLTLFKSESWQYENEWRLIAHGQGTDPHISFNCIPAAIYLGEKIPLKSKKEILDIISRNNGKYPDSKVSVYQMKVNFQNRDNELEIDNNPIL